MASPKSIAALLLLLVFASFELSSCQVVKGKVSCLDCKQKKDLSGLSYFYLRRSWQLYFILRLNFLCFSCFYRHEGAREVWSCEKVGCCNHRTWWLFQSGASFRRCKTTFSELSCQASWRSNPVLCLKEKQGIQNREDPRAELLHHLRSSHLSDILPDQRSWEMQGLERVWSFQDFRSASASGVGLCTFQLLYSLLSHHRYTMIICCS